MGEKYAFLEVFLFCQKVFAGVSKPFMKVIFQSNSNSLCLCGFFWKDLNDNTLLSVS